MVSPSSSTSARRAPWVAGWLGPMFTVSRSDGCTSSVTPAGSLTRAVARWAARAMSSSVNSFSGLLHSCPCSMG